MTFVNNSIQKLVYGLLEIGIRKSFEFKKYHNIIQAAVHFI